MFVYAWDLFAAILKRAELDTERAPTVSLLFANVLATALEGRARFGVPRGYVTTAGEVGAVRGRIDVVRSVRSFAFERGRINCVYESYSEDTVRNRVIKASVKRLVDSSELQHNTDIRTRLRRCLREMAAVSPITLHRASFRNQTFGRNDVNDALILALCQLLFRAEMPIDAQGATRLMQANRDDVLFRSVFERFVWRFFERELTPKGWRVEHNRQLKWPIEDQSEALGTYLPGMEIDIRITSPEGQVSIIDTKFTNVVGPTQHGGLRFKSGHIYQIYTYCHTQRNTPEAPREAILLYPAIDRKISEFVQFPGLRIRFETLDLAAPWRTIENSLSDIINRVADPVRSLTSGL